ncbi:MAG: WYL domain-containing protein, partial [Clostridia bacterium]|nr:WYL domain-containing protein [Clostridia bacterium]
ERVSVQIRFVNTLLYTVVDRFGTEGVTYSKSGDSHFTVTAPVEVSDQFFAWVCGFRKRAKIIGPPRVVEQMKEFVEAIQSKYDE